MRNKRLRQRAFLLSASLLAAAISLGLAIYRWNFAYAHFGPAVVWRWSRPYLSAAAVFAIFALVQGALMARERRHQVSTHAHGLLLRQGSRVLFIPWGSIDGLRIAVVRYGFPGWIWGDSSQLLLDTNDGAHHRLTGALTDLHSLIGEIKARVFPRLLDRYRTQLERRQAIEFGPIHLLPDRLTVRRRAIPWQDVRQAGIQGGRFQIHYETRRGAGRVSLPVRSVPNADLCKQLIESIEYRP